MHRSYRRKREQGSPWLLIMITLILATTVVYLSYQHAIVNPKEATPVTSAPEGAQAAAPSRTPARTAEPRSLGHNQESGASLQQGKPEGECMAAACMCWHIPGIPAGTAPLHITASIATTLIQPCTSIHHHADSTTAWSPGALTRATHQRHPPPTVCHALSGPSHCKLKSSPPAPARHAQQRPPGKTRPGTQSPGRQSPQPPSPLTPPRAQPTRLPSR